MKVRTYFGWVNLRAFFKKKGIFFRSIVEMWSYTLCEGDCEVYCQNNMHLMSFEERVKFNNGLKFHYMLKFYNEKR